MVKLLTNLVKFPGYLTESVSKEDEFVHDTLTLSVSKEDEFVHVTLTLYQVQNKPVLAN